MTTPTKTSITQPKSVTVKTTMASKKTPVKASPTKSKPAVTAKTTIKSNTSKPTTPPSATTQTKALTPALKELASKPESKTLKILKPKKLKLIRDSFTIPKPEYLVLDDLKLRAAELKHPIKKGELLRAGIKALAAMTAAQFKLALQAVPALKTGRPSK